MTDNEKIHRILEYVCSADNKSSYDTDQIAKAINLPLEEINVLVRHIIETGDAKGYNDKDTSAKGAIGLLKIIQTKDAYKTRKYLKGIEVKYNLYFSTFTGSFNLFDVPENKLTTILDAYHQGKTHFTLSGEKHWIERLQTIKIYLAEKSVNMSEFRKLCKERGMLGDNLIGFYYKPESLALLGKDVTDDIIGDSEFGGGRNKAVQPAHNSDAFVNASRINEMKGINNSKFDLTRLITLCKEINDNYTIGNYQTVAMIGRTILNHVPPIFGYQTFEHVTANYGGLKGNKSFKKSMDHLNVSLKNIADRYLHQTIREQETLPNATQIDFRQDLDVLFEEIVRLLKS